MSIGGSVKNMINQVKKETGGAHKTAPTGGSGQGTTSAVSTVRPSVRTRGAESESMESNQIKRAEAQHTGYTE
jgi:hypothetical protein